MNTVTSTTQVPLSTSTPTQATPFVLPTGYEKINGAQYNTTALQQGAYSNIQKDPTGAFLYGQKKSVVPPQNVSSVANGGFLAPTASTATNLNTNPLGNTNPLTTTPDGTKTNTNTLVSQDNPNLLSSSKLTQVKQDLPVIYNEQAQAANQARYDANQKAMDELNTKRLALTTPDLKGDYQTGYNTDVTPYNTAISDLTTKLNDNQASIKAIEDDVRKQYGSGATESFVQSEIAHLAHPLLLQQDILSNQLAQQQGLRQQAVSNLQTGIGYEQQGFTNQSSLYNQQGSALESINNSLQSYFNNASTATNRVQDNARQASQLLLQQYGSQWQEMFKKPDGTYDQNAYNQYLQSGILPQNIATSGIQTLAQQQITNTQTSQEMGNIKVIGQDPVTGVSVYGSYDPVTKTWKPVNANGSQNNGSDNSSNDAPSSTDKTQYTAEQIFNAIQKQESGGNFNAKGASGENGSVQFMPATWRTISKQYADANGVNQSLAMTPENEQKVATWKIQTLLDKGYSAHDIALVWNGSLGGTEKPVVKAGTNGAGVKYDTGAYADSVLGNLKSQNPDATGSESQIGANSPTYNSLPQNYKTVAKDVANYDVNLTSIGRNPTLKANIIAAASELNPNFSESDYNTRYATKKSYTSGKDFQNIKGLNTAISHLAELQDAGNKLGNAGVQFWNNAKNGINTVTGNPQVTNFNAAANAVAGEMASVFKASGATQEEINSWQKTITTASSPDQINGGIQTLLKLMAGRISSLKDGYQFAMGSDYGKSMLFPSSQKILKERLGVDPSALENGNQFALGGEGASKGSDISDLNFK